MLLRIGRRREASANEDPEEVIEVEFSNDGSWDLRLSTYETHNDGVIQCHAEHTASADLNPKGRVHYDLDSLSQGNVVKTQALGRFAYTNDVHREIYLGTNEELLDIVRQLLVELTQRRKKTEKPHLKQYARLRIAEGDSEWVDFMGKSKNANAWR